MLCPFLSYHQHLGGECLFSGDYGGVWDWELGQASTLGWGPASSIRPLPPGGSDSFPIVMHKLTGDSILPGCHCEGLRPRSEPQGLDALGRPWGPFPEGRSTPVFFLSPSGDCVCWSPGQLCPWPSGWALGDLPHFARHPGRSLLPDGRVTDSSGLTPASARSCLLPGVR